MCRKGLGLNYFNNSFHEKYESEIFEMDCPYIIKYHRYLHIDSFWYLQTWNSIVFELQDNSIFIIFNNYCKRLSYLLLIIAYFKSIGIITETKYRIRWKRVYKIKYWIHLIHRVDLFKANSFEFSFVPIFVYQNISLLFLKKASDIVVKFCQRIITRQGNDCNYTYSFDERFEIWR